MTHRGMTMKKWTMRWILAALIAAGSVMTAVPPGAGAAETGRPVSLKLGLLPIFDALPFYVAEARGYFNADGLRITALPVGSALERDQLMQAGEIDGVLNEMIAVANFNRKTIQAKVVGVARRPIAGAPLFRILAAPGSGLSRPVHLANVPIAVSTHTIIEYVTDRLLRARGVPAGQIRIQSVPVIPERYQLLLQGQIRAATLPDPLAKSAVTAGAIEIMVDADFPRYASSVLSFTETSLREKTAAVRVFLKGWYRAVADINADPPAFRALLLKNIRVPKNIRNTVAVPPFPGAGVPDTGQWADVMDWMKGKGLLDAALAYETSVTADFLPK
jgi:NitT/TauT family transport system substrate-binding protein